MEQQNPNMAVWRSAQEYVEAAEVLLGHNRLWPAAVLAALSLELSLKSFLAERLAPWTAQTERGHSLVDLFEKLGPDDRSALVAETTKQLDGGTRFEDSIRRFDRLFERARYQHERSAARSVGADVVYFAAHVHKAVFTVASLRGRVPATASQHHTRGE